VAPLTAEIEYVSVEPEHTAAEPLIEPGVGGGVPNPTVRQLELLVPQLLPAVTQILPPETPTETFIEVVPCPLTIVHPAGTVHV